MKSPRFDYKAAGLRPIFSPTNIEKVWKEKVRISMRQQFLCDGVENFDFHVVRKVECEKLSRLILQGDYVPGRAQRILVEKSKGLCRQLVIPSAIDSIVLQCLSDALYRQIKSKAPTDKSYYQPKEHRFSSLRAEYGAFAAWLNFQRALFKFSKERAFVVVTDIANYYDSISYEHLRNVISSMTGADECLLDMLIHVLSSLLWQPDYMPRVEIGLPQIDLDAPRLLAHCFLYELDSFLNNNPNWDFARYMDDIDVGVDSISAAKHALKSIDLVLQTKQIRLNGGKTLILNRAEAYEHFRIRENVRLDILRDRIKTREKMSLSLARERLVIRLRISRGLVKRQFDTGNGEKILKRWINLASRTGAAIHPQSLYKVFMQRPALRDSICAYIRSGDLTPAKANMLADASESASLVDHASRVEIANHLVETTVTTTSQLHFHINRIINACDVDDYFGLYCKLWLLSKYGSTADLLSAILSSTPRWAQHERLGRLVGAFSPLFVGTPELQQYKAILFDTRNDGCRDTYKFHANLSTSRTTFDSMYDALKNPNPSRGTGITHAKFLCLISALQNTGAPAAQKAVLVTNNSRAWRDIYYRRIKRRLGL